MRTQEFIVTVRRLPALQTIGLKRVSNNQEGKTSMTGSNSPLVTPLHPRDDAKGDQNKIAELRAELATLKQSVSDIGSKATAEINKGADSLRSSIESQPMLAIGVAAAAGALLALAVMPRPSRGFRYNDPSTYSAHEITAAARRAARSIDTEPITSRFERLVDAISSIDPAAVTSSQAYGTAKGWVETLVSGVKKATSS